MSEILKKKQPLVWWRRISLGLVLVIIFGAAWLLLRPGRRFALQNRSSGLPKDVRNVILISIDTCRADHLSCYGYHRKTTPNIDAVAQEGVLFKNAISPVPLTLSGHSSMLTGNHPTLSRYP